MKYVGEKDVTVLMMPRCEPSIECDVLYPIEHVYGDVFTCLLFTEAVYSGYGTDVITS